MAGAKADSKSIVLALVVIAAIAAGGYYLYRDSKKETVSIKIGGKKISATFETE